MCFNKEKIINFWVVKDYFPITAWPVSIHSFLVLCELLRNNYSKVLILGIVKLVIVLLHHQ